MCKARKLGAAGPIPSFALAQRQIDMQLPDTFRKGVVFLGWQEGDKFLPRATGFVCSVKVAGYTFLYVVTAQHCIGRLYEPDELGTQRTVCISINRLDGRSVTFGAKYDDWVFHPDPDPPTDVAIIPITLDEKVHDFTVGDIEIFALTERAISEREIGVGDEIAIVGLFRNHAGRTRNIPVVRVGNIAAMPEEPISSEYGPIEGYLVECRSIGGLSGSPVFVSLGSWRIINNQHKMQSGHPFLLLGLMHGHFDIKDLNSDVVLDEKDASQGIHAGLGVVIPASKIVETIMQEEMKKSRDEAVARENSKSTLVADFASEKVSLRSTDENPNAREDFMRLQSVAARKQKPAD